MTHKEKILTSLRRQGSSGACTEELTNEWHIRRVGARIYDLKADGKVIAKRKCKVHGDARYVLVTPVSETASRFLDQDFDAIYADMKERANDEPDPEPPADDVEDTFHTSVVWEDDGGDAGHDSQVDQANGEGL